MEQHHRPHVPVASCDRQSAAHTGGVHWSLAEPDGRKQRGEVRDFYFIFILFIFCVLCVYIRGSRVLDDLFYFFSPFAHHVKEVTSLHKQNTCKCSGCSGVYQNAHLDKIITLYVFQDTIRIKLRIREDKRFGSVLCCYSADYF